jgi:hypothetical protein
MALNIAVSPVPTVAGLAIVDAATLWKKKGRIRSGIPSAVLLLTSGGFRVQSSKK